MSSLPYNKRKADMPLLPSEYKEKARIRQPFAS